jgi:two-component system chemotaxis response regulator CheY
MLKAILIDGNAIARDLLSQILTNGSYDVVGTVNTCAKGVALAIKHQPHIVCINDVQMDDKEIDVIEEMRQAVPKALIFMVSAELDAAKLQRAHTRGVAGFIIKPFNALTVLNTIRKTVLAVVKKQQAAKTEPDAQAEA